MYEELYAIELCQRDMLVELADRIEELEGKLAILRFVLELMPCECRGLLTCSRCEALEYTDE